MCHSNELKEMRFIYGDRIGGVQYIDHMGNDLKAVNAARNSYGKYSGNLNEKDKQLLDFLMQEEHYGVLEHNSVTFKFVVPVFVARQFHRHRTWSYNEISRRYTSFDIQFFVPEKLRKQDKVNKQSSYMDDSLLEKEKTLLDKIANHNLKSIDLYNELIDNEVCKELARGVLPHNLYTSFWGTANLRNIIHFLKLRTHSHAQLEIQLVAKEVEDICNILYPNIMKNYKDMK